MYSRIINLSKVNWVSIESPQRPIRVIVKLRYAHPGALGSIFPISKDKLRLELDEPARSITPGQSAVFYDKNILLGGARIDCSF